jgi:hypothetical protein
MPKKPATPPVDTTEDETEGTDTEGSDTEDEDETEQNTQAPVSGSEARLQTLEAKMAAFEELVIHGGHGLEKIRSLWKEKFGG